MKCALAGVLALAVVVLGVLAFGCASSGSEAGGGGSGGEITVPEMPPELVSALLDSVGSSTGEGGFRSPTAEEGMEAAHAAGIVAGSLLAQASPQIKAFAETTVGATALLLVVNKASCPICKGVLSAAGWSLVKTGTTEDGKYPLFGIRHSDGREIGLTVAAETATENAGVAPPPPAVDGAADSGAVDPTDRSGPSDPSDQPAQPAGAANA